jgi:molybdate transport system substrate-binding protein
VLKRYSLPVAASILGLALVLSPFADVHAAELRVLAGGAMSGVWADIKPQFEEASGHKLEIFFGTTPNVIKEATSGVAECFPQVRGHFPAATSFQILRHT